MLKPSRVTLVAPVDGRLDTAGVPIVLATSCVNAPVKSTDCTMVTVSDTRPPTLDTAIVSVRRSTTGWDLRTARERWMSWCLSCPPATLVRQAESDTHCEASARVPPKTLATEASLWPCKAPMMVTLTAPVLGELTAVLTPNIRWRSVEKDDPSEPTKAGEAEPTITLLFHKDAGVLILMLVPDAQAETSPPVWPRRALEQVSLLSKLVTIRVRLIEADVGPLQRTMLLVVTVASNVIPSAPVPKERPTVRAPLKPFLRPACCLHLTAVSAIQIVASHEVGSKRAFCVKSRLRNPRPTRVTVVLAVVAEFMTIKDDGEGMSIVNPESPEMVLAAREKINVDVPTLIDIFTDRAESEIHL
mmetsp:Transcript_6089/g.13869  ORF Transcript_6089/g.13869 Transcript_6089/m.13869 type:complete len:359 (+) Transcript_6089:284-1360(+)